VKCNGDNVIVVVHVYAICSLRGKGGGGRSVEISITASEFQNNGIGSVGDRNNAHSSGHFNISEKGKNF